MFDIESEKQSLLSIASWRISHISKRYDETTVFTIKPRIKGIV